MGGWDNRELCPEGACIGVIGADGRCNVCGTKAPDWTSERAAAAAQREDDDPAADADRAVLAPPHVEVDGEAIDGEPGEWDRRTLCPDGACTGVVGESGKCSVCGRTAAEIATESAT